MKKCIWFILLALSICVSAASAEETIWFGHYEQDNDLSNGTEPIEWIVLSKNDEHALLLSKYGLDCYRYNIDKVDVTWQTCALREWLNSQFLEDAFSVSEARRLLPQTEGDLISVLSESEVLEYFPQSEQRMCKPTPYAVIKHDLEDDVSAAWWLRSDSVHKGSIRAVTDVWPSGAIGFDNIRLIRGCIRPTILLDLKEDSDYSVNENGRTYHVDSADLSITVPDELEVYSEKNPDNAILEDDSLKLRAFNSDRSIEIRVSDTLSPDLSQLNRTDLEGLLQTQSNSLEEKLKTSVQSEIVDSLPDLWLRSSADVNGVTLEVYFTIHFHKYIAVMFLSTDHAEDANRLIMETIELPRGESLQSVYESVATPTVAPTQTVSGFYGKFESEQQAFFAAENGKHQLQLSWGFCTFPCKIYYSFVGEDNNVKQMKWHYEVSKGNYFTLKTLIPGESYEISVEDGKSSLGTMKVQLSEPEVFSDGLISAASISTKIGFVVKEDKNDDDSTAQPVQSFNALQLGAKEGKAYGLAYTISFPALAETKHYDTLISIQSPNGYTDSYYYSNKEYNPLSSQSGGKIALNFIGNEYFVHMRSLNGFVPAGRYTVRLFWDGMLVNTNSFVVDAQ